MVMACFKIMSMYLTSVPGGKPCKPKSQKIFEPGVPTTAKFTYFLVRL